MFTIIVPTHDRPVLLRRTLQSLISQTYQNFTVIIVSDSARYILPYEELLALQGRYVFIIRSGVPGPAESRNMGLTIANSKYIIFLDDDDTFEPGHLKSLVDHIGMDSPELLFCNLKVCNEDRSKAPPEQLSTDEIDISPITSDSIFIINRIPNSCLIYRSDIVDNIRYDTDMIIYEDWDFLLKCLNGRQLKHVPINSVVIHKSLADVPENMRRGNTRDDKIVEVMLELYKKHPAPNLETRMGRQALMSGADVQLTLENC